MTEDPKRAELRGDLYNIIRGAVATARDIEEALSLAQEAINELDRKRGTITLYPLQKLRENVRRVWTEEKGPLLTS